MHIEHVHHHHVSQLLQNLKSDEIVLNGDQAKQAGPSRISGDEARVAADRAALAASTQVDTVVSVDVSA